MILKLFFAAALAGALSASALARQDLPQAVTDPYLRYEAAAAAGEIEVAADAAREAWEAGSREQIDPAVLVVLADNAAQYASVAGRHRQAREAYESVVEIQRRTGASAEELAQTQRLIAQTALAENDFRAAQRLLREPLNTLRGLDTPLARAERARSRAVLATAYWRDGKLDQAGRTARDALEVYRADGLEPREDAGQLAFYSGVDSVYDQDYEDAAYWFGIAIARLAGTPGWNELEIVLCGWSAYARQSLDASQRRRLLDRLSRTEFADSASRIECDYERGSLAAAYPLAERIQDPVPIARGPAEFPDVALSAGVGGLVLLRYDVNELGRPENIEIIYVVPHPVFAEAAREAVQSWVFEPGRVDGEVVRTQGMVTMVEFAMRR